MKYNLVFLIIISFNLTQNYSQLKDSNNVVFCGIEIENSFLKNGNLLIGPSLGYSLKSKVFSYGINIEKAFGQNHTGIFTAGITGKFSTHKEDAIENTAQLKTRNISFGLQGNFNFNLLKEKKIIPFAGVILGYNNSLTEYEFFSGTSDPLFPETKKHSFYIYGQAGIRFFFTDNAGLTLKAGTGNIYKSQLEGAVELKF